MKAFISYSHKDDPMLQMLHKHLVQLKRDGLIDTWTDNEILAGGSFDQVIARALETSQVFIALLSPDYIASNYCYEKEFQMALEMQAQGNLVIVPIILESCDWLNTPFNQFKALPKDGKPIATWENKHTAFLDVSQSLRKLLTAGQEDRTMPGKSTRAGTPLSRNYRVKKDFDSIEKLEFVEKTFHEVKDFIKRYLEEVASLENIKTRQLQENEKTFECLVVNRNKINAEATLTLTISQDNHRSGFYRNSSDKEIAYSISQNGSPSRKSFVLAFDEYNLFWQQNIFYSMSASKEKYESKDIAEVIWNELLESVGIM